MKNKIFIGIIIALLVLLWGQLFYYNNHSIKSAKSSGSVDPANVIGRTEQEAANSTTQIETINDNYDLFFSNYSGPVTKQDFNSFMNDLLDNKKFKTLYDKLKTKSEDSMHQYFDLNKSEMRSYNIYTFEDLNAIFDQLNHVLWYRSPACISRNIDMSSIENTGEYTTFKVLFKFSNNDEMTLKFSLGNTEDTEHKIMLSA